MWGEGWSDPGPGLGLGLGLGSARDPVDLLDEVRIRGVMGKKGYRALGQGCDVSSYGRQDVLFKDGWKGRARSFLSSKPVLAPYGQPSANPVS